MDSRDLTIDDDVIDILSVVVPLFGSLVDSDLIGDFFQGFLDFLVVAPDRVPTIDHLGLPLR